MEDFATTTAYGAIYKGETVRVWSLSVVVLQIDQLIACLPSSVNQQGLLADKKREGRRTFG